VLWLLWYLSQEQWQGSLLPLQCKRDIDVPVDTRNSETPGPTVSTDDGFPPLSDVGIKSRALIVYVYFETAESRRNLEFFLRHGLLPERFADFVLVVQGNLTLQVPEVKNLSVITRENTCYDLGTWRKVLERLGGYEHLVSQYKYFVMLNGSLRGPFLPAWSPVNWLVIFASQISDEVKLVGLTTNCIGTECGHHRTSQFNHLQSMFILTDAVGLLVMWPILSRCPETKVEAVVHMELQFSRAIQLAGYRWRGQLLAMNYPTYLRECFHSEVTHDEGMPGEPMEQGAERPHHSVHPFETIFFKTNRGNSPALLHSYTVWADRAQLGSRWRQEPFDYLPSSLLNPYDCFVDKETITNMTKHFHF
jgi:hypothetical protein